MDEKNLNKRQRKYREERRKLQEKLKAMTFTAEETRFILRAARLKKLGEVEYNALKDRLEGLVPDNTYILERNLDLLELLEKRKEGKKGYIESEDEIVIHRDNVIVDRVPEEMPGDKVIVTPGLSSFIVKPETYRNENSRFQNLASKNELFLPFVAKQFGVDAAIFLEANVKSSKQEDTIRHITSTLIQEGEEFISGRHVLKKGAEKSEDSSRKRSKKISMHSLLEKTDRYIRKFNKKYKVPEDEGNKDRLTIRRELIKQTFVNKLLLNDSESNLEWGLINKNGRLSTAPMFSFENCAGVMNPDSLPMRRVVGLGGGPIAGREDIQSFMLYFGKEQWFREWVTDSVELFNIEDAFEEAEETTNLSLSDQEKDYYRAVLDKTISLAKEVIGMDFDSKQFNTLSLFKAKPKRLIRKIDKDDDINFDK